MNDNVKKALAILKMDLQAKTQRTKPAEVGESTTTNSSFETRRLELLGQIEAITLQIITSIANEEPVQLQYQEPSWKNVDFSDRVEMKEEPVVRKVRMSHVGSRSKLLLMLQLLERVYHLLITGSTATQRELYYQLLHASRTSVTAAVRSICSLLSAAPWELGILATSKGLVAGPLAIHLPGEILDCSAQGGVQIPSDMLGAKRVESEALFVLVVEKDAIFQKLLDEDFLDRLGPCILVTGKGFPDVSTRQLLKLLWDSLQVPVLALVDADPHGIEIMCVYRFGSLSMSEQCHELAVPSLRWLGVHPSDIERLGFSPDSLALLTSADESKAKSLQVRPYIVNTPQLQRQVEELLRLGKKAEIEAVSKFSQTYLTDVFIPTKISNLELL